jgi:hypothetical protein
MLGDIVVNSFIEARLSATGHKSSGSKRFSSGGLNNSLSSLTKVENAQNKG